MRLVLREKREHAAGQRRVQPQELKRRDDSVAAERRHEPRYSRVGIGAGGQPGRQQRDIRTRLVQPCVESLARAVQQRTGSPNCTHGTSSRHRRRAKAIDARSRLAFTSDFEVQCGLRCVDEREVPLGTPGGQTRRHGREGDGRCARDVVEPHVTKCCAVLRQDRCQVTPSSLANRSAHLEDIGKIGGELQRKQQIDRAPAEIAHCHPLVEPLPPHKAPPLDVHDAFRCRVLSERGQRAIRKMGREINIVAADIRGEQRGCGVGDAHSPVGQYPRVVAKHAIAVADDIAELIGHDEGVVVLEREHPHRRQRSRHFVLPAWKRRRTGLCRHHAG